MDEDDERSAYYSSVQDPSADDSVSALSHDMYSKTDGHNALSLFFQLPFLFYLSQRGYGFTFCAFVF